MATVKVTPTLGRRAAPLRDRPDTLVRPQPSIQWLPPGGGRCNSKSVIRSTEILAPDLHRLKTTCGRNGDP